jgi:hypothetical protein
MDIRTGLVIGIHKKELDFGRQVAAILPEPDIRVVQIDQGLPQQESFNGKGYYYSTFHREIYLQLHQQIKNKIDLLIDLHTGINEFGRCADIYCSDSHFLYRFKETRMASTMNQPEPSKAVRLFEIKTVSSGVPAQSSGFPVCHTIIPGQVWEAAKYSYVGLEVYLKETGKGQPEDWYYAVRLIEDIIQAKQS